MARRHGLSLLKNGNESLRVSLDHPDAATGYALLMEALGTADADFLEVFSNNWLVPIRKGTKLTSGLNFMVTHRSRTAVTAVRNRRPR
jgi:hypothetical protein